MTEGIKATLEEIINVVEQYGYNLISTYSKNWKTRVVISDKVGYKYDTVLRNIQNTKGSLNFVDIGNKFSLENINLWLSINNKEIELSDENVYRGTEEKMKFYHRECDEFFISTWHKIHSGGGCPVCSGMQVVEKTSLQYLRPDLVEEWSPLNSILPSQVTISSNKKIYWICKKCGYGENGEWIRSVDTRTREDKIVGCPACCNPPKIATDRNRLTILFPELIKEWDFELNKDIFPENFTYGSKVKVWWICPNGHSSYFSEIGSRTSSGAGCIKCSYEKLANEKRKTREEFEKEVFQLVKNEYEVLGEYTGANRKIKMIHKSCSYIFDMSPKAFLHGNRCPQCKESKGEKRVRDFLIEKNIEFRQQFRFDDCVNKRKLPFDFYIQDKNILIEYDGILHYEDKFENPENFKKTKINDSIKNKYCEDNNIKLIRIPYWEFNNIESILIRELNIN